MQYDTVAQAPLQAMLTEHLQRNLVKFGRTWHYQTRGIPQVGTCSPICCSPLRILRDFESASFDLNRCLLLWSHVHRSNENCQKNKICSSQLQICLAQLANPARASVSLLY